jgi:hypothetical protein
MKPLLLSTAYLPPLHYFSLILNHPTIYIEQYENFVKQSYRNRCEIYSSNGKQILSIPLIKQSDKELIKDKKISYSEDWQKQHWRAITSAYKNSPFFEFFEDEIKPFYHQPYEYIIQYNTQLLYTVLNILRVKNEIQFTNQYVTEPYNMIDKRNCSNINNDNHFNTNPYYQVFSTKNGFISNLSCLDIIFNTGLETKQLLSIP